ncbi:aromatic ring-hydroxylating dioxygenase subunit alpha [Dactylosporangium sp. NPDC048998]|uniref:aromatic ring-hydroxylating oxygenase subunit alpha n=1 Tax=Dactylosporangium sp. NPDC048998 TaxID=3363976 RepID=UPI00371AAB84
MSADSTPRFVIDDRERGLFRVNREVFVSDEVLDLERRHLFDKAWLYVGHESEISNPNDFHTRQVGGRTVIFTRDRRGVVRVLLNTCRHRGAEVCRERSGNRKIFTCFYHGWAYDNSGALVSVPDSDSYSSGFDRSELGLAQPRVDSYRGFVFATFSQQTQPLLDYLADATHILDQVSDLSDQGMRIVVGTHRYSMRANWKLLMENSVDGYHALTVHQTYFEMMMNLGTTPPGLDGNRAIGRGVELGNGHAVALMPELGSPLMSEEVLLERRQRRAELVAKFGEEHAIRIANMTRNMVLFPNSAIIDLNWGIQVRTMYPIAPGHTEIVGWQLMPEGISEQMQRYRIDNALSFWGPAGLATPDDVEGLEQCQRGFASTNEVAWSDISRGMKKENPAIVDELQMRAFWREWNKQITGESYTFENAPLDTGYIRSGSTATTGGA